MKRIILIGLASIWTTTLAGAELGSQDPAGERKPTVSGKRRAMGLFKITWNTRWGVPFDVLIGTGNLHMSPVYAESVKEVFGIPIDSETFGRIQTVVSLAGDGRGHTLRKVGVWVKDDTLEPAADEFLEVFRKHLEARLRVLSARAITAAREELKEAEQALHRARAQRDQVNERRLEIIDSAGQTDVRRETVFARIRSLREILRELESQLVGSRARQRALQEQIARLTERARQSEKTDEALTELNKVVEIRKKRLDRAEKLVEQGNAGEYELMTLREQLALGRVKAAERREALRASSGGDLIAELNADLVRLSVDTAESDARLAHAKQELAKTKALLPFSDRYDREIRLALPAAEQAVRDAESWVRDRQPRIRSLREPTVTNMQALKDP